MPPVLPMLSKSVAAIPPGSSYEPKWDGFRSILFRDGDEVELGSRNETLTRYSPNSSMRLAPNFPRGAWWTARSSSPLGAAWTSRLCSCGCTPRHPECACSPNKPRRRSSRCYRRSTTSVPEGALLLSSVESGADQPLMYSVFVSPIRLCVSLCGDPRRSRTPRARPNPNAASLRCWRQRHCGVDGARRAGRRQSGRKGLDGHVTRL